MAYGLDRGLSRVSCVTLFLFFVPGFCVPTALAHKERRGSPGDARKQRHVRAKRALLTLVGPGPRVGSGWVVWDIKQESASLLARHADD